jgi:hypothetical protein
MKNIFYLILVFATGIVSAQNMGNDVVHLKNGSIIKGTIIKNPSDSTMAVKTKDGSIFVYNKKDVDRTVINVNTGFSRHNNLWIGFNLEPQFQSVFKSPKEEFSYNQQTGGSILYPGTGGVQLGAKIYYLPEGIAGFETGLQYHFYQSKETLSRPFNSVTEYGTWQNKYHNIEIPVLINVHSYGKKVRFYTSDGISAGITLGARHSGTFAATGYTFNNISFTTSPDSVTAFYCTILASAGAQVSINASTMLNITAAFRLSPGNVLGATNPYYTPGVYAFIPYSLGLNVEILFHTPDKGKNRNGRFSIPSEAFNTNEKQPQNQDKLRSKHETWNNCFMVLINGDTIKGKVRRSEDYSVVRNLFSGDKVLFAHPDESEEKIGASQFKELYIPKEDPEYRKFITLSSNSEFKSWDIYRVELDGKCQLLSDELNGPGTGDPRDRAYIYYKDTLTEVSLKGALNKSPRFLEISKPIFSDCPVLVQKIETKKNQSDDLSEMIKEFNKCIGNH